MLVQFNKHISTKGYKYGEFTSDVKSELTAVFNYARNWKDSTKEFKNIIEFYQYLIENLQTFRFGIKEKSNSKKDAKNEISAIAIDLDLKPDIEKGIIGCSIKRTLEFAKDYNHVFYLSPSGRDGDDNAPHRLILAFNNPQTIEVAERYSKYISTLLQGKAICFDATRIWFPPLESTVHLSRCSLGKGIEELIIPDNQTQNNTPVAHQQKQDNNNDNINKSNSITNKINKILASKALEMGFKSFLKTLDITDVEINQSRRIPENGTIEGEATLRFDVKPVGSNCSDRVTANLIDDLLFFYDRRDGTAGYTGSFLKFLLLSTGETEITFQNQLVYAKEIFKLLDLEWIEIKTKKLEASNLWYQFLEDVNQDLIFIKTSQKYAFFNGKFWELYNPEELINTLFVSWSLANYGIIKAAVIGQIKTNLKTITFDKIKIFKNQPIDRHLYGFQDGVFNVRTKQFIPFSQSNFIWNISEFFFNDTDLDRGKAIFDKFNELVSKTVVGDCYKQTNFIDAFSLLILDSLWKSQTMLWMHGEGGAGKSTFANWIRDMLGSTTDMGKVSDLRANELFASPHSIHKVVNSTIINLSEFTFPSNSDASFLKDMIASGATENSDKIKGGCAIPVNEKYKDPYTYYWLGSIMATSQETPNRDCLLDSGWTRRINFFLFQKIKETTTLFKEIDAGLGELFVYILHLDMEFILSRYNNYFRCPNIANEQILELELSPVAAYLEENCEIGDDDTPVKVLYREFHNCKTLYGVSQNYVFSLKSFNKYLNRYLLKFYNTSISFDEHNLPISRLRLKAVPPSLTTSKDFNY